MTHFALDPFRRFFSVNYQIYSSAPRMERYRLNLKAIEHSIRAVQREFPKINEVLQSRRDSMTDEVVDNMLAGYALVDKMLVDGTDVFSPNRVAYLLELNHRVLCGLDARVRLEHHKHIEAVTTRFYYQAEFNIDDIVRWYGKHRKESPWKRAAGVYVRLLSQPQLYIEGNHRTGALIMSYILAQEGNAPFVLTIKNAQSYFDPSTTVKETRKSASTLLMKLPRIKKRFAEFLRQQANAGYLQRNP